MIEKCRQGLGGNDNIVRRLSQSSVQVQWLRRAVANRGCTSNDDEASVIPKFEEFLEEVELILRKVDYGLNKQIAAKTGSSSPHMIKALPLHQSNAILDLIQTCSISVSCWSCKLAVERDKRIGNLLKYKVYTLLLKWDAIDTRARSMAVHQPSSMIISAKALRLLSQ